MNLVELSPCRRDSPVTPHAL